MINTSVGIIQEPLRVIILKEFPADHRFSKASWFHSIFQPHFHIFDKNGCTLKE